ncbi:MAG: alpha/beta hydrolase [Pseudomonadota bacterium]
MTGPKLTRRALLAGAGSTALLAAGCGVPYPVDEAEAAFPPIGEMVSAGDETVHLWRAGFDGAGAGRTPLVLIHGASGNLRDFTFSVAPKLAQERPVIAVDRPGFGYSSRPAEGGDDPRVQARIIREAVLGLGVERPIVLGHSYGAAVSMGWALEAPETLTGVIPVSGVTMPYTGAGAVMARLGVTDLLTWAYTEYLKSIAEDGGIERFLERVFRPQPVPPGYAQYVGAALALRETTLYANMEDLQNVNRVLLDVSDGYGALEMPFEIVHGTADFIEPGGQAQPLHKVLPRARLTLLPNIGHMAHHASPELLAEAAIRIETTLKS